MRTRSIQKITICMLFLIGCSHENTSVKTVKLEQSNKKDAVVVEKPEQEEHIQSQNTESDETFEAEDGIGRPVITHKYDSIFLSNEFHGIGIYADNVMSVIDPEDGALPFYNIGGVVGPQSDEDLYGMRHPGDNPKVTENRGPFYYSMGYDLSNNPERIVTVDTVAYDSEGHVSVKVYEIHYIPDVPSESHGILTVKVEDLRVRDQASTSGNALGFVWPGAKYYYYEVLKTDEYTWYRIGNDLWIADNNGDWISIE